MPAPELQSLSDAAARAASAGDHASAERLLTELAEKQEAALGPRHPALASTLNNLGVVCEALGKPDDAERHFRRACAIAAAILPSNHAFVSTSRKNLEDLCRARGHAVDWPPPLPASGVERAAPPAREPATPERDLPLRTQPAPEPDLPSIAPIAREPKARGAGARGPFATRRWPGVLLIGVLAAAGLVAVFIASGTWFRSDRSLEGAPGGGAAPPAAPGAGAASPAAPPAAASPAAVTSGAPPPASAAPPAPAPAPAPAAKASPAPAVVTAELCRDLSKGGGVWHCTPPGSPVAPGTLYFYTRLKSPVGTTVQHRWYHGDRLHLAVTLQVGVNTASGWRTDSRVTLPADAAGAWRVELRSRAGAVLDEERFVVGPGR